MMKLKMNPDLTVGDTAPWSWEEEAGLAPP